MPEVVILGADGSEHVFPDGFDPKRAAAIVRGGAPPAAAPAAAATDTMSEERWAALPVGDKVRNVAQWGGKALAGMFGMNAPGILSPGTNAVENPGLTLASGAIPLAAPVIARGVTAIVKNPVVRVAAKEAANVGTFGTTGRIARGVQRVGRAVQRTRDAARTTEGAATAASGQPVPPSPARPPSSVPPSEPNWRTVDAVPINAMKTPGIIEAGESQVGLSDRMAALLKNPTPANVAEAQRLAKALRQRAHIGARKP